MKLESLVPLALCVFDLFDNNGDGTVDMREILCRLSSLRNSCGDDALRLCFQMCDADRSHQQGRTGVDAAIKRANKLPVLPVCYDMIYVVMSLPGVIVDADAAREVPAL